MAYQEKTTKSWGNRLKTSFVGIIIGIGMFLAGTAALYSNEGRSLRREKITNEVAKNVIELKDTGTVEQAFDGKLVHASGFASSEQTLIDDTFNIQIKAIKLKRAVEYYQWTEQASKETRKNLGGSEETVTTYTYEKKWASTPVDSSIFKDPAYQNLNTTKLNISSNIFMSNQVYLGAYKLPDFLVSSISAYVPLKINISEKIKEQLLSAVKKSGKIIVNENTVFIGNAVTEPEIGDVMVKFYQVPSLDISLIAKVYKNTFENYTTSDGNFTDIRVGLISSENMISNVKSENSATTFILRIIFTLCIILGLAVIAKPLSVIADIIPFIGNIIGYGSYITATILGFIWSIAVIALSWLRFRPEKAILLIIIAGIALIVYMYARNKKKKS